MSLSKMEEKDKVLPAADLKDPGNGKRTEQKPESPKRPIDNASKSKEVTLAKPHRHRGGPVSARRHDRASARPGRKAQEAGGDPVRLEKKIDLGDGRSVTVKELRIKDIRKIVIEGAALYDVGFLEMLTDGFDNVLHLFSDCIDLTSQANRRPNFVQRGQGDLRSIQGAERLFFRPDRVRGAGRGLQTRELDRACVILIGYGHRDVFDYGFGFFTTTCKVLSEQSTRRR